MLTGWDSNKKVRIRPGKQLIPSALADITLPVHLNSSSGVYGKDMSAMFADLDPVDPHWSSVVLAMPMDGAAGSTTFTDLTGKTVTRYGNTQISTAQSVFGGSSAYFDGSGDYLTVSDPDDFSLVSGDFTIEFRFYGDARSNRVMGNRNATDGWMVTVNPGTGFGWVQFPNYAVAIGAAPVANAWNRIAICRSGDVVTCYLNGVAGGTPLNSTNRPGSTGVALNIGRDVSSPTADQTLGYIDDLRITVGVARYTENFTPPSRAIATTSPTYSGLNPLAKKIALEIGNTGVEVPISIFTQDWDNADNTAEAAKIYAVFEDLEDGDDFTLYWDSAHADNTNVTEISSAPAAPGSGDALTVWNLASTDDLWLIATEFYTISGTVTVSAVAASRRVVVFDESRIYQSFFSDASDGSYGCFVPSTGPFNIAMIGNAGEYPKIFSGVTAG